MPHISKIFRESQPSAIRRALIISAERKLKEKHENKKTDFIVACIGNVILPTHSKIAEKIKSVCCDGMLDKGIIEYTSTEGIHECRTAIKNIIGSFVPEGNLPEMDIIVLDGSTPAMRLVILGLCENTERPILGFNPLYTNYNGIAEESGKQIVCINRQLRDDGSWTIPSTEEVEAAIKKYRPGGLLIIPYDNPTGQFMPQATINEYARLCIKYDIFLVSDEAYRGLLYTDDEPSSIWNVLEKDVPGIGKAKIRISLETLSKVFNACGLRIGALVTDNKEFYRCALNTQTKYLCAGKVNQYIASSLGKMNKDEILSWVEVQRNYYSSIMKQMYIKFKAIMPDLIVSRPDSAIYMVLDVRNITKNFDCVDFVDFCAERGSVNIHGKEMSLLVAPMCEFYSVKEGDKNPGDTQMRISIVDTPERMLLMPEIFKGLLMQYLKEKKIELVKNAI